MSRRSRDRAVVGLAFLRGAARRDTPQDKGAAGDAFFAALAEGVPQSPVYCADAAEVAALLEKSNQRNRALCIDLESARDRIGELTRSYDNFQTLYTEQTGRLEAANAALVDRLKDAELHVLQACDHAEQVRTLIPQLAAAQAERDEAYGLNTRQSDELDAAYERVAELELTARSLGRQLDAAQAGPGGGTCPHVAVVRELRAQLRAMQARLNEVTQANQGHDRWAATAAAAVVVQEFAGAVSPQRRYRLGR